MKKNIYIPYDTIKIKLIFHSQYLNIGPYSQSAQISFESYLLPKSFPNKNLAIFRHLSQSHSFHTTFTTKLSFGYRISRSTIMTEIRHLSTAGIDSSFAFLQYEFAFFCSGGRPNDTDR